MGELFCGPGGLALGAKRAVITDSCGEKYSIKHVWANDIDKSSCETYIHNICKDEPHTVICADIKNIDFKNDSRFVPIDALTFGFPCNDFSLVGEKKGLNGKYGPLYSYGVKALNIFNPKWFLVENVRGLQSSEDGSALTKILSELEDAGEYGYEITPHLYKFEQYSVPQTRHRIIIIGIRKDLGLKFKIPKPLIENPDEYKTAKQALESPPIPIGTTCNERTNHPKHVIERLSAIPPGENAWYENIPNHLRLNVKGARMNNIYRRLYPDKPAYTVTGSGGGGTHMYHYAELRALTNRERARLQTFPDDYDFKGSKKEVRAQIGMAVPPDGAQIIFEAVLKTFAGISYESIEPKWDDW